MAGPDDDALAKYRRKRRAGRTPEPFGGEQAPAPPAASPAGDTFTGRYVVQKHAARRLHYDFRLEWGGALKSWAVPKGPSFDPADKRSAIEVEDHPLEYADFEGTIPAGNYGAGAVIVWDRGAWRPVGDAAKGLAEGKLVFELAGDKLRGEWTLVRTRRGADGRGAKQEWLLLKHRDGYAGPGRAPDERSVLSGLTLEELAAGEGPAPALRARLEALRAPRREVDARTVKPALAEREAEPFGAPGWLFEIKYDGYRVLGGKAGREAALFYRSGQDCTRQFPEVARALASLPCERAVLDGEITVLDAEGRPSFQRLQGRAGIGRDADVARVAVERPAVWFVFDLLAFDGFDLRGLPLAERKALLSRLAPRAGPIRYADHVEADGEALWRVARERGLEGIVAKRADAPYPSGRGPTWKKIRGEKTGDFAVAGFTAPGGPGRTGFGALHLATLAPGGPRYAGSVGGGFDEATLRDLHARLVRAPRASPPAGAPRGRGNTWVKPSLVVEVRYLEITDDGLLRHPIFLRVRDDKRVEEAERAEPGAGPSPPTPLPAGRGEGRMGSATAPGRGEARTIAFSNREKLYFPADALTKGDLLDYYRAISPWLLPWLRDRPVVLTRYPDGIDGKSFFQKDAPSWRPPWIRTVSVWSEDTQRDLDHFICDDLDALLYVVNLGSIPLHAWASRARDLGRPDWTIVDLDPKTAPFSDVVTLARALHDLCDEVGLPSYVKTTGQAGLHVLVPLGGQCTHEQARQIAGLLAAVIESEHGDIATTARAVSARRGRVYLDTLQNGWGKTIASVYAARPRPGAPVSTPLRWREVGPRLDPSRFTIRNAVARAEKLGEDPHRGLLVERPDLVAALGRLQARLPPDGPTRSPPAGSSPGR